jgi:UDP-N-acetylglucosamine acyltransferase
MESSPIAAQRGVRIHPEAVVHADAWLEGDVEVGPRTRVGPGCMLLGTVGPVSVGADCQLLANVTLCGPLSLGDGNVLYPQVCIGLPPQDLGFAATTAGPGCVVGHRNVFREGVTVHRGKTSEPTRIGDGNHWMAHSHLGHDGVVADGCTIGTGSALGGHVVIEDRVTIGRRTAMHQFARLGHDSVVEDTGAVTTGLAPWFVSQSINAATNVNHAGLRQARASAADILAVEWVFDVLYRSGETPYQSLPRLRARAGEPIIDDYLRFIEASPRGLCHGSVRARRGHLHDGANATASADGNEAAPGRNTLA